jgi:hypothetical protein
MKRYWIATPKGRAEVLGHSVGVSALAVRYTEGRWSLDHLVSGRRAGLFVRFEHARLAAKALRSIFGERLEAEDFPDEAERARTRAVLAEWIGERAA